MALKGILDVPAVIADSPGYGNGGNSMRWTNPHGLYDDA
jgi:hypothetical protein